MAAIRPKRLEPWYEFTAQAGEETAELRIFGPIGGGFFEDEDAPTGKLIAEKLDALPDTVKTIRVLVNSPGGNVFEAIHIANALKRQRDELGRDVEVDIEALAGSAATIVTSAGDPIRMPANALMMIHNPFAFAAGDHKLMRQISDVLGKVKKTIIATYRWVSTLPEDSIGELMDETTWMDAAEAVENGFATEVTGAVQVEASISADHLVHLGELPDVYRERILALIKGHIREGKMGKKTTTLPAQPVQTPAQPPSTTTVMTTTTTDPEALEAAARDERERILTITDATTVARAAGVPDETAREIARAAINNPGETVDEVREKFFAALQVAKRTNAGPGPGPTGAPEITDDQRDRRRRGICAGLWDRSGVTDLFRKAALAKPLDPMFQNMDLDPGEYRGMSILDHARESLELDDPGSTRGLYKMQVAGTFFTNAGHGIGHQTTGDFAVALEEALHKVLLAAYALTDDKWREFCAIGSVSDFRAHNRYRLGFLSRLDEIGEGGEFQNKVIPDATKEIQQAKTWGNILALTRKTLVNDDMGVFTNVATTLGRAAGLSIELEVFDSIKLNGGLGPLMNDSIALFNAAHNNLGAGAVLSVSQLDENKVVMANQKDATDNEILDLRPAILLIPIGLEGAANVINNSQFDTEVSNKFQVPNKVVGLFRKVVGTGRIIGTRQYLFADPAIAPTFEVAFLEGQQSPMMEIQDGWRVDGVEWKIRHDFGVAAVDFRAAVTDAGV